MGKLTHAEIDELMLQHYGLVSFLPYRSNMALDISADDGQTPPGAPARR
jgi:hypothetical protein